MLGALVHRQPTAAQPFPQLRFLAKLGRTIHLDGWAQEEAN